MHAAQRITCRRLLLLVVLILEASPAVRPQPTLNAFDLRVGKGTTLTEPPRRSMFISIPMQRYSDDGTFIVYLEQNLSLSEKHRGFDLSLGISPMLRVESSYDIPRLSVEAGAGINFISARMIGGRQLGSNLLFGPTVCAGVEVPWAHGHLGVFYMFRHLSNASMFEDNDGVNFQYIVISLRIEDFP